MNNKGNV